MQFSGAPKIIPVCCVFFYVSGEQGEGSMKYTNVHIDHFKCIVQILLLANFFLLLVGAIKKIVSGLVWTLHALALPLFYVPLFSCTLEQWQIAIILLSSDSAVS